MSETAVLPERAGARSEAQDVARPFPEDLTGKVVELDGHGLAAGSSSFMDELVKEFLEVRHASRLVLDGISERAAGFARSAADRRGVTGSLTTNIRR